MLILLKFLELRQMGRHFPIGKSFTIPTVISHGHRKEVISHNADDIQLVAQVAQRLIFEKFMFCISHRFSHITLLTPVKWVGPTHNQAVALYMSVQCDMSIKPHFRPNVKEK